MKRYVSAFLFVGLITFSLSCSTSDQEQADRKAAEAKAKTRQAAHEASQDLKHAGQEMKADARKFEASADKALQGGSGEPAGSNSLNPKLHQAGDRARVASHEAAKALDHAALIAQVKSKLAADAGLSTLADISVDTSGHIVTLRGTVDSEQQKRQAEEAASQVSGVSKVVDDLTVRQ
ncbi:MAG: BON domain-containing protein [Bryobacteraceae bacterium]